MLIKGCFDEYPLLLLFELFLHRRETGLLEISGPMGPGYFYIKDGELLDAVFGKTRGNAALNFALELKEASFEFNALSHAEYAGLVWRVDSQKFQQPQSVVRSARQSVSTLMGQLSFGASLSYRLTLEYVHRLQGRLGSLKARVQRLSFAIPRLRLAHVSIALAGIVILACSLVTISEIQWIQNRQPPDNISTAGPNSSSQAQSRVTAPKSSKRRRRSKRRKPVAEKSAAMVEVMTTRWVNREAYKFME